MNKIPFYFSVDFEDFYHDKKRQLGHLNPDTLEKPLWKSYEKIKKICENLFSNKKITFFSTGILAKKAPDLFSNIAKDSLGVFDDNEFKIILKNLVNKSIDRLY